MTITATDEQVYQEIKRIIADNIMQTKHGRNRVLSCKFEVRELLRLIETTLVEQAAEIDSLSITVQRLKSDKDKLSQQELF